MTSPEYYSYVSTKCGCDPVRTIFLLAPDNRAGSVGSLDAFARESGWVDAVEESGDLLVCPVAPNGWSSEDPGLVQSFYLAHRNDFRAPSGRTIPGRDGTVWTWEPLIHVVGYSQGAIFAGNFTVAHPAFAASTVLVDGTPSDYTAADEVCDHWCVPNPSTGYSVRNREVPVAVWLVGSAADDVEATSYFAGSGVPEWALACNPELGGIDPAIARRAITERVDHIVRWKNGTEGTLAWRESKDEFYSGTRFEHRDVTVTGRTTHYAIHLPAERRTERLALVLSVHGRGEPTWLFSDKNGWEDLADETGEFAVMLPDSEDNIWSQNRDDGVIAAVVADAIEAYGLDSERVYMTGFSNGAAFTWQQSTTHPELFAAASPSNCPPEEAIAGSGMGDYLINPAFMTSGFEMPYFIYWGDNDNKAPFDQTMLERAVKENGCDLHACVSLDSMEAYPEERGYSESRRFDTNVWSDSEGRALVCLTKMLDMPHGAIVDEARAAWEFMSGFRRVAGVKSVEEVVR